jgi:hypothetical protein
MNVALSKKKVSTQMKEDMLGPIGTTCSKKIL